MRSLRVFVLLSAALVLAVGACQAGNPNDLLAKVKAAGKLVVSTDPAYPPQSELVGGVYQGFDIDVATEIAKRLGVAVAWETPDWTAITAGSWGGRWDVSVGSMTITTPRQQVVDFSPPYYFTPAQMAASTQSGITTIEGLADKTICVGDGTTYLDWLNGSLDLGDQPIKATPQPGMTATTQPTDRDCAQQWGAGRFDFEGWLTSSTTVDDAIADGVPLVKVGDPVYFEPLAVAVDKSGPPNTEFMAELKKIVEAMHADGTLAAFSNKWFGEDLTKSTS